MATDNSRNAGSVRDTAPGLDIFKTPENPTFYSSNLYRNLDKRKQEIRLIELSTQTGGDGILECKLLPATLLTDIRKQYLALSYCAGDPTNTKEIMVSGVKCNVFANLHHALVLARHYWIQSSEEGPLRLWIDQLCINQHDLSERSHQVGFMRDIYQSAERTLACLSTSTTSGEGLKWFNDLCDAVPFQADDESLKYDAEEKLGTEGGTELQDLTRESAALRHISKSCDFGQLWFRIGVYLCDNMYTGQFVDGWIAFYDVLTSPWWNRVWICQEFLVSSQVTFMFGNHFISWEKCWRNLESFCSTYEFVLRHRNNFQKLQERKGLSLDSTDDGQVCRLLKVVRDSDNYRQAAHVKRAVKMKIHWNGSMHIRALLSHSRSCKSSDDRDRVYAILGLASPGYQIFPESSYHMTAAQVMITTTKAIIDKEDSLCILVQATTLVRSRNLEVPSWVVDWTITKESQIPGDHFGNMLLFIMHGFTQESPEHIYETIIDAFRQTEAHIIRVYGRFITNILVETREWPFVEFYSVRGWKYKALASIADEDELWMLQGLRVPIVLRPYRDGYQAISCAFTIEPGGNGLNEWLMSAGEGRAKRSRIVLY
ncbi:unnamed protein product [Fusarium fujikuroi]|nr:hypothetical protein CEK25_006750 [Fusarium fujikuroi]SCO22496.1 uncharacterized protein FFE2_15347 [Fusarium fujikuroi]VTT80675.1 unnamed protein product [Fusarium fujikuroi]